MATTGKDTVVLVPSAGLGHLIPLVELGRRFLSQGLSVAIITLEPIFSAAAYSDYVTHTSAAIPSISFHRLPPVTVPPISSPNAEAVNLALLGLSIPNLLPILTSISSSSTISSLVLDFFCTDALDLAANLNLRTYFYFTCSGNALAAFIHLPVYGRRNPTTSFKDLGDTLIHFPGIPPLPATHMPLPVQDREDEAYRSLLYHFDRLIQADGIIVNTVRSIESRAIKAVEDGLCSAPGRPVPPIYCIGPVVSQTNEENNGHCISWLDSQPRSSVLFLCFGSMVMFTVDQLKEIATGLERSGHRFLWTVRNPPGENDSSEPDLEHLLPPGFEERTRDRGMVVKSWAPQAAVLRHEAVGGFVTHCGWNSVLEAVCTGVPMIAWPLYAEQRMNKVFLVEEMKLAKEMKGYEKEIASAEDVEMTVRWLMESEEGKELKERAAEARQRALAAISEGGASHKELMELVNQWKLPRESQSHSEENCFVEPTNHAALLVGLATTRTESKTSGLII